MTLNVFDLRHNVLAVRALASPEFGGVDAFGMRDQKAAMVSAGCVALDLNAAKLLPREDAEDRGE
jgi:hypothetical protein